MPAYDLAQTKQGLSLSAGDSLSAKGVTRLSVNLTDDTAAALRDIKHKHGSSVTREITRAIAILKFFEDETAKGNRVLIQDQSGLTQELKLL